jgi:regulatory protein
VAGQRRGARSGRGWDALPPRSRARSAKTDDNRSAGPARQQSPAGDPAERAREICLQLLAVRPRTRAEMAAALRRRGIPEQVAAGVLDRYDEVGLIDDAAFARAWVTTRHHGRGLARTALAGELRRRGVDPEIVRQAVDGLDGETEAATARALVERKLRSAYPAHPEALLRRLVGMLARKGYPPGLAYRVVKEALAADDRTALLADQLDSDALADLEATAMVDGDDVPDAGARRHSC